MMPEQYELTIGFERLHASEARDLKQRIMECLPGFGLPSIVECFVEVSGNEADFDRDFVDEKPHPLVVYSASKEKLENAQHTLQAWNRSLHFSIMALDETAWQQSSAETGWYIEEGRFLLYEKSGDEMPLVDDRVAIALLKSSVFGDGQHASTRALLGEISRWYLAPTRRNLNAALDIGTGNGVLAIALKKIGFEEVVATEVDPQSLKVARENAGLNKVDIHFLLEENIPQKWKYDLVCVNIQTPALLPLLPEISRVLEKNGTLMMSGFTAKDQSLLVSRSAEFGLKFIDEYVCRGWLALAFVKL